MKASYPIYRNEIGDEFIFPSHKVVDDEADGWSKASLIIESMMFRITLGLYEADPAWLDVEGALPGHFVCDVRHSSFFHGAATVFLLSGPTFDEFMKNTERQGIDPSHNSQLGE